MVVVWVVVDGELSLSVVVELSLSVVVELSVSSIWKYPPLSEPSSPSPTSVSFILK